MPEYRAEFEEFTRVRSRHAKLEFEASDDEKAMENFKSMPVAAEEKGLATLRLIRLWRIDEREKLTILAESPRA